jgi:hypothetical protein
MPQPSIEWALGQQCHRLICLAEQVGADHLVTVYFDGIPVRSRQCRTENDLKTFVESQQRDWQAYGWQTVDVPTSFMRFSLALPDGVNVSAADVASRD